MARNFSGKTMAACCEALAQFFTDGELQNFFTRFELLAIYRRLPSGTSKLKRIQEVIAYLDRAERTKCTDEIWDGIVHEAARQLKERADDSNPLIKRIEGCLAVDGYCIENNNLLSTLPAFPESTTIRKNLKRDYSN